MNRRKIWLFRGVLTGLSLVISIGALELGLRVSNEYGGQVYSVNPTGSQYKFYMFDARLGWASAPKMHGTYSRDEFTFPIRVNEFGMRDAPVEQAHGQKPRIAVLGDSFTWGIGVSDEQRFTEKVEEALGVEVLNFGISGYSPIQYYLIMDDVISFDPDVVVIAFCLGNDFADNVLFERYGYFKPYAELSPAGEIVVRGYPLPNVDDFGFRKRPSGLVLTNILKSALMNAFFLPKQRGLVGFKNRLIYAYDSLDAEDRTLADKAIAINAALLGKIQDRVTASGKKLVLLPVPTKCEYSLTCKNDNSGLRSSSYRILEDTADRLGIGFIPTLDAIDSSHFWEKDGHWRPSGHARIAARP